MRHPRETEIKLEVTDPGAFKLGLANLGFRTVEMRHFENNVLFDFPDLRLRRTRCLLRLRFARRQCLLTFKGAPLRSRSYKIRGELETRVEDGQRLKEILEALGLRETFRYEKYRTVYALRLKAGGEKAAELTYDETPIGDYLELEGPERWIDEVAHRLGYRRKDYITQSYAALYRRKCLEKGERPGNMVFEDRKS